MKKNIKHLQSITSRSLTLVFSLLVFTVASNAQLGIGTNPDVNSILHAKGGSVKENIILEPGTNGGVGIGVLDPNAKLEVNGQIKITDGNQGEHKVLMSDADGLATWTEVDKSPEVGDYKTVTNPVTGKTWLDRNLGASQVATSSNDATAFGDLYQWGRAQDGHEIRSPNPTTHGSQATSWIADEGTNVWDEKFITGSSDWLNIANDELWEGAEAENNPCPSGFRIPTNAEWNQERRTWATQNAAGAYGSVLKLTAAGFRLYSNGSINSAGSSVSYWSSTAFSGFGRCLYFNGSIALLQHSNRSYGFSVRCIKN